LEYLIVGGTDAQELFRELVARHDLSVKNESYLFVRSQAPPV
jgi:hypothetical protein